VTDDNLYWPTRGSACSCIIQSDRDGYFQESVYTNQSLVYNLGFALDAGNQLLYVCNGNDGITLGGFGKASRLVDFGDTVSDLPMDVDIDSVGKTVYYAGFFGISTSDMNGNSIKNICPWQTCGYPTVIRLDPSRGKAYFSTDKVYNMVDLSGANSQVLFKFDENTGRAPWARGIGLAAM